MSKVTTIKLKIRTRNELRAMGRKGQSYDELIKELVESRKSAPEGSTNNTSGTNRDAERLG